MRRATVSRIERLEAQREAVGQNHVLSYPNDVDAGLWLAEHAPPWPVLAVPEALTVAEWTERFGRYWRARTGEGLVG